MLNLETMSAMKMKTMRNKERNSRRPLRKGQAPNLEDDIHVSGTENLIFPGPLMCAKMQKNELIKFIQKQCQKCLLDMEDPDNQKSYFFWLIMELFCKKNGRVRMHELSAILFVGYSKLRYVNKKEAWCLPLAELLSSKQSEDELQESVVSLGNEFASKGWLYASHICFVLARMELQFDSRFMLIGCDRLPDIASVKREMIERTEVYEYVLSLTTGTCQINFQGFKCVLASMLAEAGLNLQAYEYCEIITTNILKYPMPISKMEKKWLGWIDELCRKVLQEMAMKIPQWLTSLRTCLNVKLDTSESSSQKAPKFRPSQHSEFDSRYTVGKLLGQGGFGSVYAGFRKADGKPVAIKYQQRRINDVYITIPGEKRKLPVEVGLLKMMSKPPKSKNVVHLLDYFKTLDFYILVLERPVPCMDVHAFIARNNGRLSEAVARKIMSQVVEATTHCCKRGVLHRDIKHQNILINPDTLEVKLIDFGCGCLLKNKPYNAIAGTPIYWPPEWYLARQYLGIPATVWSLGIFLSSMVNGFVPFYETDQIIAGHLRFRPDLSEACCDLIRQCLKPNAEDRPSLRKILDHRWFMEEHQ